MLSKFNKVNSYDTKINKPVLFVFNCREIPSDDHSITSLEEEAIYILFYKHYNVNSKLKSGYWGVQIFHHLL